MDLKETILKTLEEFEEEEIVNKVNNKSVVTDKEFLKEIKERLLVLFHGLQSPNTDNLDVKLDVTLNFLQYLLTRIDEKLNE